MNLHKTEWLESVRHIHAQDAAWFFFFCLIVLGIGIIVGVKEDEDE